MSAEPDLIARFYLFVVAALLVLASGYTYLNYGLSTGFVILAVLAAAAFWGLVSASARIRRAITALFSSGM